MTSPRAQQLLQQRKAQYADLESVIEDELDPLAAYDNLVKWTLHNYASHSESGLLELLEECLCKYKDDVRYRAADLRYVKLWILFANHVDKPAAVYAYMMEKGIGKLYSLFFEEYAEALEREGRYMEAETIITLGIRTRAISLKHLQSFQDSYHARRAAGKALPIKISPYKEGACPANIIAIRTDPLRKIAPRCPGSALPHTKSVQFSGQQDISITTTQSTHPTVPLRPNPYAHLNAPTAPGKRPEKLMFDLTLLLSQDGTEYCFAEARARHLGLLDRKWPPPPPPNAAASSKRVDSGSDSIVEEGSARVDFNDRSRKLAKAARRQSVTVTINTKQALEDVFDMYNSPGEEEAANVSSGTVETPSLLRTPAPPSSRPPVFQDENAGTATKPRAFQAFADQRRENITPGLLKFKPSANKTPGSNAFTPNLSRKALIAKELVTPVPAFKVVRPSQNVVAPVTSEIHPLAEAKEEQSSGADVFGEDVTADEFTEDFTHPPPPPPPPRSFVPFVDNTGDRPLQLHTENAPALSTATSKILKFQVHRDEDPPPAPAVRRPSAGVLSSSQPLFKPMRQEEQIPPETDEELQVDDVEDEYQEVEDRQCFPRSDRFANFDVMTPITERTFEFTTSTRGIGTPGSDRMSLLDRGFIALDAQEVAEKLAAELQEEEGDLEGWPVNDGAVAGPAPLLEPIMEDTGVDESGPAFSSFEQTRPPFRVSDGLTIEPNHSSLLSSTVVVESTSTNVADVMASQPGFESPIPCNPSDPDIISSILSLLPVDPNHRDLRHIVANKLSPMQRFVEKRARRGSGASSSGRASEGSDRLGLELDGDLFEVFDKLGEGGFGAVFMTKDLSKTKRRLTRHEDEDEEDLDQDDDDGLVAVKAVRPANVWESYMLHRIVSALPEDLRRSIIHPHRLYAFEDESFLVLDLCQQGTLLEVVNNASKTGVAQPGGGVEEIVAMFFTVELLRILQGLHDHGFIHGDLKIDNCLIRLEDAPHGSWSSQYSPAGEDGWASKGIKLIDFGRTVDTKLYPPGQTYVADWKTDARDCTEMREGRPWTFQTDYAGLASIIYCMLFGRYIETTEVVSPEGKRTIKPSQPMKRYWQVDLWNRVFEALLNPCQLRPDGALPITDELVALRRELETWIECNCNKAGKNLKGILKKIGIASECWRSR
ncbi:Mad3/BUB1 homology region 1-domain-containing protein [Gautieria morchelliformis]|nr:Mad3/BUB1 homology region 1-domain-containing protein [Gautieria morchelliformis]